MNVIIFSNLDSGRTSVYRYSRETIKDILSDVMARGDFYINLGPDGSSGHDLIMDIIPDMLMVLDKPGDSLAIYEDMETIDVMYELEIAEVQPNF